MSAPYALLFHRPAEGALFGPLLQRSSRAEGGRIEAKLFVAPACLHYPSREARVSSNAVWGFCFLNGQPALPPMCEAGLGRVPKRPIQSNSFAYRRT